MSKISFIHGQLKYQILQTWFSVLRGLYTAACSIWLATFNLQMAWSYIKKEKNNLFYIYWNLIFFLKPFTWGTESWDIPSHSKFSLPCFKSWIHSQINMVFALPVFLWFVLLCIYLWHCRIYAGLFRDFCLLPSPVRKIPAKITVYTPFLRPFSLYTFSNQCERKKS